MEPFFKKGSGSSRRGTVQCSTWKNCADKPTLFRVQVNVSQFIVRLGLFREQVRQQRSPLSPAPPATASGLTSVHFVRPSHSHATSVSPSLVPLLLRGSLVLPQGKVSLPASDGLLVRVALELVELDAVELLEALAAVLAGEVVLRLGRVLLHVPV